MIRRRTHRSDPIEASADGSSVRAIQRDKLPPGDWLKQHDFWLALLLSIIAAVLHLVCMFKAGGLWRDEAAAVQLATMPRLADVVSFFPHEAFPLLFPGIVRGWSLIFGQGDLGFRAFGCLVGLAVLAILWWNALTFNRGAPLLGVALVGFNGAFIQWADSVRGYGVGTIFILLTVGALWRLMKNPGIGSVIAATLCAVASVQCLFQNSVLVLALCLGAAAVVARREEKRTLVLVLLVGLIAGLSLIPYSGPLSRARDWDALVQSELGWDYICMKLGQSLSSSGGWMIVVWLLLILAGIAAAAAAQIRSRKYKVRREEQDILLFSGTALIIGIPGYLIFLGIVRHPVQEWHLVALVAFIGSFVGLIFQALKQYRWGYYGSLGIAVIVACGCLIPACGLARIRRTNIDLIAGQVQRLAAKEDLVVVSRWYFGLSFRRYFDGPAPWIMVPNLNFDRFHRYDLIKSLMMLPDQNEPVRTVVEKIDQTLKGGHRVWLIGQWKMPPLGEQLPDLPPAPSEKYHWQEYRYTVMWGVKVEQYLQGRAVQMRDIEVPTKGKVNEFEDLWLKVFDGR